MITLAIILSTIVIVLFIGHRHHVTDWGGYFINCLDGLMRLICRHVHRLQPTHIDLPTTGSALVVANHVSGLDPFLLMAASSRPLRFMIALDQYQNPLLNWLYKMGGCIPVDREGRPEVALRAARQALEAGEVIALYPHGKIHLDTEGPRKLKGGVTRLALWTNTLIYPVRIDGVAGQGKVIMAPFIPSNAELTLYPPLSITDREQSNDILSQIQQFIERPQSETNTI